MEPTLDEVRQELADIHDKLLELPTDDYSARVELRSRQTELRQTSARLVEQETHHEAGKLSQAYDRLHKVRDRLVHRHLVDSSTSVGDDDLESALSDAVNRAIHAGVGVDEIEDHLNAIIERLRRSG